MSRVFVDTSAILALLISTDRAHREARQLFLDLSRSAAPLVSTSYVLVETYALLVRRFGVEMASRFRTEFSPLLEITWIDEGVHERALDLLFERRQRRLSLVDAASFVVIADSGIEQVFAFDQHFIDEGFSIIGS